MCTVMYTTPGTRISNERAKIGAGLMHADRGCSRGEKLFNSVDLAYRLSIAIKSEAAASRFGVLHLQADALKASVLYNRPAPALTCTESSNEMRMAAVWRY